MNETNDYFYEWNGFAVDALPAAVEDYGPNPVRRKAMSLAHGMEGTVCHAVQ